jgi:hypothetical protein
MPGDKLDTRWIRSERRSLPGAAGRLKQDRTQEDERLSREAGLDKTLADSFPASDPPSTLPNPEDDEARESRPHTSRWRKGEIGGGDATPP